MSGAESFWTFESIAEHAKGLGSAAVLRGFEQDAGFEGRASEWIAPPRDEGALRPGVVIDAREVGPGQTFVALPGERADGRRFLSQAAELGAGLAIVALDGIEGFDLPEGLPVLGVENPAVAMAALAEAYRGTFSPETRVIGVTGSNGKTTTTRLIDSVLKSGGLRGSHSQKSFNNHLGLPVTLLNARPGDDYVICEMGTSSPGEIGWLTKIARPDISVIVSIGRAHLEKLGSVEGVAREKAMILRTDIARSWPIGIVPSGVPELEFAIDAMRDEGTLEEGLVYLYRVGEHGSPTWRIQRLETNAEGSSFELWDQEECLRCCVPLLGEHNAHNAAIAAAVGRTCEVTPEDVVRGLAGAVSPEMRLGRHEVELPGGTVTVLHDAYNANPDSARAALRTLAGIESGGRRVAVLGDLLELGEHTASSHAEMIAEVDGMIAAGSLDLVILIGEHFTRAAQNSGRSDLFVAFDDPSDSSIEAACELIEPGDLVLLKGSRGMRLERVVDTFSQACR